MLRRGYSPINCTTGGRVTTALALSLLFAMVVAAQESQPPQPPNGNGPAVLSMPKDAPVDSRTLTLPDAQQRAQLASAPLVRLGELQVEAARQHRLGVKSMYFPAITTQFDAFT